MEKLIQSQGKSKVGQLLGCQPLSKAILKSLLIIPLLYSGFSCAPPQSNTESTSGDIEIRLPMPVTVEDQLPYSFQNVILHGISNLKEMAGRYAQFFLSPGLNANQLVGNAPKARFIKSVSGALIPKDNLSLQMASLYYHMEKLADLDIRVGAGGINYGPRKIGLKTLVGSNQFMKNNGFYDGITDAILFVPFDKNEVPIAVNAGIIAHEHFHSLFYKKILKKLKMMNQNSSMSIQSEQNLHNYIVSNHIDEDWNYTQLSKSLNLNINKENLTENQKLNQLYNQTLLRGINEGLADYWAWLYTDDSQFLKWSLSDYNSERSLKETKIESIRSYPNEEQITGRVRQALRNSTTGRFSPSEYLSNYIYEIGTAQAKFLKKITEDLSGLDMSKKQDFKMLVATEILRYLDKVSDLVSEGVNDKKITPENLFLYFGSEETKLKLDEKQCQFILDIITESLNKNNKKMKCVSNEASSELDQKRFFLKEVVENRVIESKAGENVKEN